MEECKELQKTYVTIVDGKVIMRDAVSSTVKTVDTALTTVSSTIKNVDTALTTVSSTIKNVDTALTTIPDGTIVGGFDYPKFGDFDSKNKYLSKDSVLNLIKRYKTSHLTKEECLNELYEKILRSPQQSAVIYSKVHTIDT